MPRASIKYVIPIFLALLLFFMLPVKDSAARKISQQTTGLGSTRQMIVRPADVYLEFSKISQLINAMGYHMGISPPSPLGVKVSNVTPYDIYFQALSVFNAANRLSFETLHRRSRPADQYPENIHPADIVQLAFNTLEILNRVADDFGLSVKYTQVSIKTVTPKDVYREIVNAKRYLNLLLERRFSPSDVYQLVNQAIGYASRLLRHYHSSELIPRAPDNEAGKRPWDVFFRLNECLQILSRIYEKFGLEVLELDLDGVDPKNITPADVFDLASLIVARLHFYSRHTGVNISHRKAYYPGHKYPSHVYRQAGILLKQLNLILSKVEEK